MIPGIGASIGGFQQAAGGGGGGSGHRYWRINTTAVDGGARVAIGDIQMRTTSWGANVATGGTAYASDASFGAASNAFDGNSGTSWRAGSATQWIAYDFGSAKDIQQVVISAWTSVPTESPKDFTIQYSDDNSAWTTWATITGQTGWSGGQPASGIGEARAFSSAGRDTLSGAARYWCASFANNGTFGTSGVLRVVDFLFRETSGGSNISGGTPSVSSVQNSTTAAMAYDGNTATHWDSDATYPVVFYIDFGASNDKNVVEILIQATSSDWPKDFKFYRSKDAFVYDFVWAPATQSAWTDLEIRTFTKP